MYCCLRQIKAKTFLNDAAHACMYIILTSYMCLFMLSTKERTSSAFSLILVLFSCLENKEYMDTSIKLHIIMTIYNFELLFEKNGPLDMCKFSRDRSDCICIFSIHLKKFGYQRMPNKNSDQTGRCTGQSGYLPGTYVQRYIISPCS